VGRFAQGFCSMVEEVEKLPGICTDLLENHGPIQSSYESVCRSIEVCPTSPDGQVPNDERCNQCKEILSQYTKEFCDEYEKFVNQDPSREYTGGCHTMLDSMDIDDFGYDCRKLDQCPEFAEILLPSKNNINGINMTNYKENIMEDAQPIWLP